MPVLHTADPRGAVPRLLWVPAMSLFCSGMLSSPPRVQGPSGSPSLLPHVSCKLFALCPERFQLFVLPYVYFRRPSGEDIFTPIKLINCQRERDTVLVTGITVNLLTWHREGKGKGWRINYSAEAVLRRAWLVLEVVQLLGLR